MGLLSLLSYAAAAVCFVFVTLSLASGLLYLAEIIEEHSRSAKSFGQRMIYVVIALHVALWAYDSLPLPLVLVGICAHLVYLQNFGAIWPFISLTSPSFILSCVLVIADHFLWFHHFASLMHDARRRNGYQRPHTPRIPDGPTFAEVAAFFGVCIWMVPLFLFLSLSANDNALPTMSSSASRPGTPLPDQLSHQTGHVRPAKPSRASLFKSVFDSAMDLMPSRFTRRGRQQNDGIIASHTPRSTSPVPGMMRRSSTYGASAVSATGSDFKLAPPPPGPRRMSSTDEGIAGSRLSPRARPVGLGVSEEDFHVVPLRPASPLRQVST
ncbi:DUF396-domain-containing protein [Auriculariales sp. MPI-PUGE-AT-0066]|nr:DUF396-domain-containing protein [Auriculariales sp. MPI-PUGE-AT-0066]